MTHTIDVVGHRLARKQERFVHAYLATGNATDVYRRSHSCEKMSDTAIRVEACRLRKHPNVTLTIESFRTSKTADSMLPIERHMAELRDLRETAKASHQISAAVRAEELRGRLRGFYSTN